MAEFQNRYEAINEICSPPESNLFLNIFGESGIGKSRLLREVRSRLENQDPAPLILNLDFKNELSSFDPEARPITFLQRLIGKTAGQFSGVWKDQDQLAGEIVARLSEVAERQPVYLFFDTTEALQEDVQFWKWLEVNWVEPLLTENHIKLVFAGRIPAPWHGFLSRRALKLLPLKPLDPSAILPLVKEIAQSENPTITDPQELRRISELILGLSFGHPLLTEAAASYFARHEPPGTDAEVQRELCRTVVRPFIDEKLFEAIDDPLWRRALWLLSVLNWFDLTTLQRYLPRLIPEFAGQSDYFFIQKITQLRIQFNVIISEEPAEYRLHGLIREIVRHCLMALEPEVYGRACRAAAEMMREIADDLTGSAENPEKEGYLAEAERYAKYAQQTGGLQ